MIGILIERLLRENEAAKRRHARKYYVPLDEAVRFADDADRVLIGPLPRKPLVGIVRETEPIDGRVKKIASWLRYERFLRNNDIPYEFYDVTSSEWLRDARRFDIIVWHTPSTPAAQNMAESKIYVLDKILGKACFPSFDELWQYENKSRAGYLYEALGLPGIPTFMTNSYTEAEDYIARCSYPMIAKIDTASKSQGVVKLDSERQAQRFVRNVFLNRWGRKTRWHYVRQKDYVYFQPFIDDATFDLRIFVVDGKAFGYYRYPNKGDFKASGAGNYEKKEIPADALRLAVDTVRKLNSRLMSVDMLYSPKQGRYYIIETSLFNRIDTPEQLVIDGVPGYYDLTGPEHIVFRPGRYWLQELSLKVVVEQWAAAQHSR